MSKKMQPQCPVHTAHALETDPSQRDLFVVHHSAPLSFVQEPAEMPVIRIKEGEHIRMTQVSMADMNEDMLRQLLAGFFEVCEDWDMPGDSENDA